MAQKSGNAGKVDTKDRRTSNAQTQRQIATKTLRDKSVKTLRDKN